MYHLWSFSLQEWKQKTENNPKIKVPSSILNWNYCYSSMKETPLACLRCPHPFGLWWPPMAPIPGAVGRAFACVGPWLPVACGETEAITAGPWLARPRAPSPISHHGFLLRHPPKMPLGPTVLIFSVISLFDTPVYTLNVSHWSILVCIQRVHLVFLSPCPLFSSSVLPTHWSATSRWIPMTG